MLKNSLLSGNKSFNSKNFKNNLKLTLSGISGAFILPIGTLAVCAIFLTLGALIEGFNGGQGAVNSIGKGIKALSFPIIKALPFLFCVAFAISFTKNNPDAIWCSIICYLVFLGVQNAFISENINGSSSTSCCEKCCTSCQDCKNCSKVISGYKVLFNGWGRSPQSMLNIVDKTLGITALNTSIFGSLLLGGVLVPFLIKRFSNIQLPKYIAFFSGKRFLPFVSSLFSGFLALLFLVFWPWAGTGLSWLGRQIAKTPYGLDSFVFGFLEKSLIPFGLHHFFYSSFWYSSLGGDVISSINEKVCCGCKEQLCLGGAGTNCCSSSSGSCEKCCKFFLRSDIHHSATSALFSLFHGAYAPHTMWQGDSFIGLSALSLPSNTVSFCNSGGSSLKVFEFLSEKLGIKVGRFTQGKYPIMQFALPATGLAMIYSAPKTKRKDAKKVIVPAILSSLILGITEPIEFLFLYLAPALFYGFHAVACGLSFMLMNILGARIPSVFSGGILEFIILGVIPMQKGTNFYNAFLVGAALAPLYFLVFYSAIKRFNIKTPGREDGVKLDIDDSETVISKVPEKTRKLAIAFGGWDNLSKISNCASRLRYDIVDKSKVDEAALKSAGVIAVKWVGDNHVQAIVGPQAESINNEMLKYKGEDLGISSKSLKPKEEKEENRSQTLLKEAIQASLAKEKEMFSEKIEISEEEKELLLNFLECLGGKSNVVQYFSSGSSLYIELINTSILNVERISSILSLPMYRIINKNTFELFLGERLELFFDKFDKFFKEHKEFE